MDALLCFFERKPKTVRDYTPSFGLFLEKLTEINGYLWVYEGINMLIDNKNGLLLQTKAVVD